MNRTYEQVPVEAAERLDQMTAEQRRLLLYLEARAVDYRGCVDSAHMNADDFKIAKAWAAEGFLRFCRIPSFEWHRADGCRHAVELTDLSWLCAAEERRRRATRSQREVVPASFEHFEKGDSAELAPAGEGGSRSKS